MRSYFGAEIWFWRPICLNIYLKFVTTKNLLCDNSFDFEGKSYFFLLGVKFWFCGLKWSWFENLMGYSESVTTGILISPVCSDTYHLKFKSSRYVLPLRNFFLKKRLDFATWNYSFVSGLKKCEAVSFPKF